MARVLVTRQLPAGGLAPLFDHELIENPDDHAFTKDELVAGARQHDAIVCLLTDRIDADVLAAGAAAQLKVVANVAVGYDNIDVAAANELGVAVVNTPGVLDDTTADLAFFLAMAARRQTTSAESDLRLGRWSGWGIQDHLGLDVYGATLGLVGYGRIAQGVARRAQGFAMTVLHHTRSDTGAPGWVASLDELLARADIVSLHVPLSDATRNLIGARELALMGPHAVVVNTARGPVLDEDALVDALEAGTIYGAGLDVFGREPDLNPRLLSAPRCVLLPHIGSATIATRTNMALLAAQGVAAVLAGERPKNLVTN